MENISQIKDLIATLNLESSSTVEIVKQIDPILKWHFIWLPLIDQILFAIFILVFPIAIFKYIKYLSKII